MAGPPRAVAAPEPAHGARPVDVRPLSDDVLGQERPPSWLLELEGDAPHTGASAGPVAGAAAGAFAEADGATDFDEAPAETSYIEPETTRTLLSRALVPAGAALVFSFAAAGGYAFFAKRAETSVVEPPAPLAADAAELLPTGGVELVRPPEVAVASATRPAVPELGRAGFVPPTPSPRPTPPPAAAPAPPALEAAAREVAEGTTEGITERVAEGVAPGATEGRAFAAAEVAGLGTELASEQAAEHDTEMVAAVERLAALTAEPEATAETALPAGVSEERPTLAPPVNAAPPRGVDGMLAAIAAELAVVAHTSVGESSEDPGAALADAESAEPIPALEPPAPSAEVAAEEVAAAAPSLERVLDDAAAHALLDELLAGLATPVVAPSAPTSSAPLPAVAEPTTDVVLESTTDVVLEPAASVEPSAPAAVAEELSPGALAEATPAIDSEALAQLDAELAAFEAGLAETQDALSAFDDELAALLRETERLAALTAEPVEPVEPVAALEPVETLASVEPSEPIGPETSASTPPQLDWDDLAAASAVQYPPLPPDSGPLAPTMPVVEWAPHHGAQLGGELDDLLAEIGPRRAPESRAAAGTPPVVPAGPNGAAAPAAQEPPSGSAQVPTGPSDSAVPAPPSGPVEVVGPVATKTVEAGPRSVLRRAESEGSWQEVDVPNSVAHGPEFLLTPYTGNVRVVLDGGDVFEGRLHGAGAGRVSLDTRIGRMALDARRLQRIERLAPEGPAPKSPAKVTNDTTGLEEVRVVTRGGTFTGHLVARDGTKVTLLMREGYRMSVEALEVTPVTGGRGASQIKRPADGKDSSSKDSSSKDSSAKGPR